jgi:hypothetical protein
MISQRRTSTRTPMVMTKPHHSKPVTAAQGESMNHRLLWALLPVMVVLGTTAGYLAAGIGRTGNDESITAPAHDHTTVTGGHDHTTPAGGSTTAAGHNHDRPNPSGTDAAGAGPTTGNDHNGSHGGTATGVSTATRGTVIAVFAAINLTILAAAALVRRHTRRTHTRRPAAQAA